MPERDPYTVLGVPPGASTDAIGAAYRELARRFHPDVSTVPDAERRMAEINAAWAVLRDPERRAAWDQARWGERAGRGAGSGGAGPAGGGSAGGGAGPTGPGGVPRWYRGPNGIGAAGPPPGPRRGSVVGFGRHVGWSIGEIARADAGYLAWLRDRPEGAPYREEIGRYLEAMSTRPGARPDEPAPRRRRPFS